jgi:type I restriction-modification system DNA methylase subunit/restriction endonuclease S subunit
MLDRTTKQRIFKCRDILVGQLTQPADQINMITLMLVYKFMSDMDEEYESLGKAEFFSGELEKYSWKKIIDNTALSADENIADRRRKLFFEGIATMQTAKHLPELFKTIFNKGNIPNISDNNVFKRLIDEINKFRYSHSEELGNAFEYLLMTMGTQSKNGQFRTPRHIIEFVVEAVAPDKDDTFLDPACGTAGFLIAAFNYLRWKYTPEDKKEVLMEISGQVQTEIEVEKKVKKEIVKQIITITHNIYSTSKHLYIENPKKENIDEMLPEGEYRVTKAEIVYKKKNYTIKDAIIWHNGKNWELKDFKNNNLAIESISKETLELKPIAYTNVFNLRTDKESITNSFQGYDNTPLMVRLAMVNMYLHEFKNPQIHEYDTISNQNRWKDTFSCILANPPFMTPTGGVKAHSSFTFSDSTKAEIIFTDYITSHLNLDGKAGIIVPEGIIFTNNNEYTEIRKKLLYDLGLWAVVSLPAGVFQPYSGVKTSILLIDKQLAKKTDKILLLKIENDGFTLNTNRNPTEKNDLPKAVELLTNYKLSITNTEKTPLSFEEGQGVGFLILDKTEFAKLDAYKAANVALNAVATKFKALTKSANSKRIAELETEFLETTQLPTVPKDEAELKTLFNATIKEKAIAYGNLTPPPAPPLLGGESPMTSKMSKTPLPIGEGQGVGLLYRTAIDNAREYNLSFDKYAFANEEVEKSEYGKVELGEVAEFVNGFAFKPEDWESKGLPIIRIQNLTNSSGKETNRTTRKDIPEKYLIKENDLLISWSATIGFYIYKGENAWLNQHIFKVNADESKILKMYLYYLGEKIKTIIDEKTHGNTMKHITKHDFDSIQIPLPPLETQQKLVSEIATYQKLIDGARAVIENYEPQFEMKEEWEKVRLGEVFKSKSGTTPSREKSKYYENGTIAWVKTLDLNDSHIIETEEKVTEIALKECSLTVLPVGTVLVAMYGGFNQIGRTGVLTIQATTNQAITALLPNEKVNPNFLNAVLNSKKEYWRQVAQGTRKDPNISKDDILAFEIPLPPLSVQSEIVEALEAERQAVEGCKLLIAKYEARIKAVIEKVF